MQHRMKSSFTLIPVAACTRAPVTESNTREQCTELTREQCTEFTQGAEAMRSEALGGQSRKEEMRTEA